MPITTLFLGAGASRAIGFPTTSEFMVKVAETLPKTGSDNLVDILKYYEGLPEVKDIEHVLEILDTLITFDSNPYAHSLFEKINPSMRGAGREYDWKAYMGSCKRLKDIIIDELYRQYEFDPSRVGMLDNIFGELVDMLARKNEFNQLDIFTTNYDRSIEEYSMTARSKQIELIDGFPYDEKRKGRFWKPEEYQKKPDPDTPQLRLFKLHGSLDWRETYSGEFESVKAEERCLGTRRYRRNVLIYPTQKGLEVEEPFATLHRHLKEINLNSRLLTVVGFSFRDQRINEILLSSLHENNKLKLVVVSPNAKRDITDNLLTKVQSEREKATFDKRVIPVQVKLGDKDTVRRIFESASNVAISKY
ncbi:SIR2 family protein [Candidatus Bathyarchaeota archaeon]|nr:SIR2 family protein [Candidatus Bathyarchaeota archaeon]